ARCGAGLHPGAGDRGGGHRKAPPTKGRGGVSNPASVARSRQKQASASAKRELGPRTCVARAVCPRKCWARRCASDPPFGRISPANGLGTRLALAAICLTGTDRGCPQRLVHLLLDDAVTAAPGPRHPWPLWSV